MKKPKKPQYSDYKEWFKKGSHDIDSAELLYDEMGHTDTICFHVQQAVEKYLKGFLSYHEKEPRRIHNLEELLKDCAEIEKDFFEYLDDCSELTRYYIESRYPIPLFIEYSRDEARVALEKAMEIIRYVQLCIKKAES